MIYLLYNKSLNICKTLQNYSQDINYYKTVKKVHKKVIKKFHHFTTFTLPLYGNQMNRTTLMSITLTTNISLTSFFSLTNTFMTRSSSSLTFYIFGYFSMTRKASTKQLFRRAFSRLKKCFTAIQARSSKGGLPPSCFF